LFCKYERGPKLVDYLESLDYATKKRNIAFGLVNKIGKLGHFEIRLNPI